MIHNSKLYFPPAVTVDAVIFTVEKGQLKVLLVKRLIQPFNGRFALPGGFLMKNETSRQAAGRILKEKTGLAKVYLEQLYTFDDLQRDPRGHVLTVAYFALINRDNLKSSGELRAVSKLPKLAFDHKDIIAYALQRLRYKLEYTNAVYALLPKEFVFSQLQNAYEAILGRKADKRNFRKKFLSLGLLRSTRKQSNGGRQRPAELFRFISLKPAELKRFF